MRASERLKRGTKVTICGVLPPRELIAHEARVVRALATCVVVRYQKAPAGAAVFDVVPRRFTPPPHISTYRFRGTHYYAEGAWIARGWDTPEVMAYRAAAALVR